jgi:hypothetical protein
MRQSFSGAEITRQSLGYICVAERDGNIYLFCSDMFSTTHPQNGYNVIKSFT